MSTLTVATLNLHGRYDRWRQRRHLVVAQLLDAAPDLISLQEISRLGRQGTWLKNQINHRLSGPSSVSYHLAQKWLPFLPGGSLQGVGILSRLPLISHDGISLGPEGEVALRANVLLPSGQSLDFVSVHLYQPAHARETRQEQIMALLGWLNSPGHAPLQVVAGDFNEVPDGPAIRQMKQAYLSTYALHYGREPLATFPTALASAPNSEARCLDYIFVSPGIEVVEVRLFCDRPDEVDDTLYPSDHVGLLAALKLSGPEQRRGKRNLTKS